MAEAWNEYPLMELTIQGVTTASLDIGDIVNVRKPSLYCGNATGTKYLYLLTRSFELDQFATLTESFTTTSGELLHKRRFCIPPNTLIALGVNLVKLADPKQVYQPFMLLGHDVDENGDVSGGFAFTEIDSQGKHLSAPVNLIGQIWDKEILGFADVGNL